METIPALVAEAREREEAVLAVAGRSTTYSYREFCTSAWKAGNLLRHYGAHPGGTVAVTPAEWHGGEAYTGEANPAPPILATLAGPLVGAAVGLAPTEPIQADVFVGPASSVDEYETAAGCSVLGYGDEPESATTAHFERELWSENPVEPPESVAPGDEALHGDGHTDTHEEVLAATRGVLERTPLDAGDAVELPSPPTTAGQLVGGVLAPMLAGATITIGQEGDVVVASEAGSGRQIDPTAVR